MKAKYVIAPLVISLFLIAIGTNPSYERYANWRKQQVTEEQAALLSIMQQSEMNEITIPRNFGIFTIYETEIQNNLDKKRMTVGLFNMFFTIHRSNS